MEKYIAYYRVSTQKQGKSGLGLEAQKSAVMQFLSENDILLGEYTDIESGKRNNRPNLLEAIAQSKKEEAILLIAKLDRLSRNAAFIFTLRDTHVKFKCVDMPEANSVTIGIMAVLAQDERERISQRTKAALSELKKQGKKLGSPQNLNLAARKKGFQNNQKATALIVSLRNQGLTFYRITKRLNALNFKTRRGNQFQQNQVKILFDRYYGDLQEVLKE